MAWWSWSRHALLVRPGDDSRTCRKTFKGGAKGIGSLAITLSLGVDDRAAHAPLRCRARTYAVAGPKRESRLGSNGFARSGRPDGRFLMGFSRGGRKGGDVRARAGGARRGVLLAPTFATAVEQAEIYQRAFGHPLAPEIEIARKEIPCRHARSIF